MTKAEFIKKFNLEKTGIKATIRDGRTYVERELYTRKGCKDDEFYAFYNNDLCTVKRGTISGEYRFTSSYSWYH